MFESGWLFVSEMLLKCKLVNGIMGLPNWYKMKKVQDGAFRRVLEAEKYKIGTSNDEKKG